MLEGCVPWPETYAELYRAKGYWEDITLSEMFEKSVEKYGSRVALVYNDESWSYAQLGETVNTLAYHLSQTGLRPLDKVIVQLPNIPDFVYTFLALVKIGVIPIMALPAHRLTEISHFVKASDAVGYVIPAVYRKFDYRNMAEQVQKKFANLQLVFVAGEANGEQISLDKLLESPVLSEEEVTQLAEISAEPSEVALMLLSGGTTALPKLIPRTHNDYVLNCKQCGLVGGFDENTVYLAVLPLGHNFTLVTGILANFAYGGKVVISPGTNAEAIFALIQEEKVSVIAVAVPLVTNWLDSSVPARYNLESLRVIQNGGMRLPTELRVRVIEEFGCIPQEVYGTAEGLINMTHLDDQGDILLNSSGAPVHEADEIKVVDDSGNEVPDGEAGELLCRGPYTIRGYYNALEINRDAFTEDGFYHMGDIVRKRGRYVYAEGRKKELINRGGEKISCDEVENFIYAYPKVKEVCVVGMPDEVFGEKACAFVVPKQGETITFTELVGFLSTLNIAKFKLPERLEVVDQLPISPAGKILKRVLGDMIAGKLEQEKAAKMG